MKRISEKHIAILDDYKIIYFKRIIIEFEYTTIINLRKAVGLVFE